MRTNAKRFASALLIMAASIVAACSTPPDDAPVATYERTIDDQGIEIVTSQAPTWGSGEGWTIISEPEYQIGVEEGAPEQMLSRVVGAVAFEDGRIAVANGDSSEVRFFTAAGDFEFAVGRHGQGPNEFEYLFDLLRCWRDELVAFEIPWNANRLSASGEFLASVGLKAFERTPYMVACNESGRFLVTGWGSTWQLGLYRTTTRLSLVAPDNDTVVDLGEIAGSERWGEEAGSRPHAYGRQTVIGLGETYAWAGTADDHELEVFTLDGSPVRRVRWAGPSLELSADEIERYKAVELDALVSERRARRAEELKTMVFPPQVPAYDRLRVDPDGAVWVRGFVRAWENVARWTIFSADGTWLGTIEMPESFTVTDIGLDYVLGSWLDEQGTEYVRHYVLQRES